MTLATKNLSRHQAVFAIKQRLLEAGVDTADEDARILLRAATSLTRLELATQPQTALSHEQCQILDQYVTRREAHEPVSRILGLEDFGQLIC